MTIQQYKHYNLNIKTPLTTEVLDVHNTIIYKGTEKACKRWINREWKRSQDVISYKNVEASYIGDESYNISRDGETLGRIKIETTKRQVTDYSGKREFKIITKHQLTLTLKLGYNQEITLTDYFFFFGGLKTAIKQIIKRFNDTALGIHATNQLEIEAKKQGFSDLSILNCFHSNRLTNAKNLLIMITE